MSQASDDWNWSPTFVTTDGDPIDPVESPDRVFEMRREGDILEYLLTLDPGVSVRSRKISQELRCEKKNALNEAYRRLIGEGLLAREQMPHDRRKWVYWIPKDAREDVRRLLEEDPLR